MCDQTVVSYRPGNVVWVKLNPVWWPGVVADSEEIPPEILKTLRKTPIAIVKFFQETEVFEYVHKLSNIYHYNCLRKNDFIRKGLDMYRSKNRDAPSHMKLFPADVARAEVLTGGDPNILNDEIFQPEEKPTYADLFANSKKSPKKIKSSIKKKSSTPAASQKPTVPRIITHPRFIKLNSGLETDYEVRERKQEPVRAECDEEDNSPPTTYRCQDCDFTTIRLNVIVLHNKSHTRNYAKPAPSKASKRKNISAVRVQERSFVTSERDPLPKAEAVGSKISETNGTVLKARKKGRPKRFLSPPAAPTALSVTAKTKEEKTKTASSRSSISKPKRSIPQKDAIQESLLEDWAEFETEQDNLENGDTSFGSSLVETESTSTADEKTVNESHSASKKDEFDFDDTEEQLIIDKTKIRAGRKIPRVLEEKSEEFEKVETENVKKRRTSGVRGKHEDSKMEIQEDESKNTGFDHPKRRRGSKQEDSKTKIQEDTVRNSGNENVRKRRTSSGLRRTSEDTKIENHQEIQNNSKATDVKRRKLSRTGKTSEKETKVEEESKIANLARKKDGGTEGKFETEDIVEVRVEEEVVKDSRIKETSTEVQIEEMHEEIGGEIEIETESTMDDEQVSLADIPIPHDANTANDSTEKEVAEFSQKVDELLQEVSVSSKLPELPQSLKKKHIKSFNANLTEPEVDDDDGIIESISLINDDSSDGFEEKEPAPANSRGNSKEMMNAHVEKKLKSSGQTKNSTSETADTSSIDNREVTSDSSPEIVSVEMPPTPRNKGFAKKLPIVIPSMAAAPGKRPPVRFTMTSKFKNISPSPMVKKNTSPSVSEGTAKLFKAVQQQKLQQSRARSLPKQEKSLNARHVARIPTLGQQAAINTSRSTPKSNSNKLIVVKPMSTQHPTTIDNIDLTVSTDPIVSSGQISGTPRSTRPNYSRSPASKMTMNKLAHKNVLVSSPVPVPRSGTSTMKLVSSSDDAIIPSQNQSEIITVNDDLDCANDNVQVEEINYIVDEAGNCIAESENVSSTTKKEDILAKALQDTDVLQTEITLPSSSTILLESCDLQNSTSTTVYENVTLNTPPIMSSFETPSRTGNSNPISEISEYIIISDPDNIQ